MNPVYLDYNATTPVDPAVLEVMLPYWREQYGNPSSNHVLGVRAREAVERARWHVAELLGAKPEEIVFTGGGTEANNQALKGIVFPHIAAGRQAHIVISAFEHPATSKPCEFLQTLGCKVTTVPVDRQGLVDPDVVDRALLRETVLISIMHANNEIGTLLPIKGITALARARSILVHTDAAQSVGKLEVHVDDLGVDLLSVAGHKVYAPKGVGALFVRKGVKLEPLLHGASHERARRAGTENVPYIVGLGQACKIARASLPEATERLGLLRDRLWDRLQAALGNRVVLNGHPSQRLPNTLNVNFVGQIGAELLAKVPEIAASTGSACHEGKVTLSPVLRALGVAPELGRGAVRLTVGRFTTENEIDLAADALIRAATR
jgi:cysteine desulfurase